MTNGEDIRDEINNSVAQERQSEASSGAKRKGVFMGIKRLSVHWIIVSVVSLVVIGVILFGVIDIREGMSLHPSVLRKEGQVEIFQEEVGRWMELRKGIKIKPGDAIRTRKGSEVDLYVPDLYKMRIKENSEVIITNPALLRRRKELICQLRRGNVLVDTDEEFEGRRLRVKTPAAVACVRGTSFMVSYDPDEGKTWVGVLEGEVKVEPTQKGAKSVLLKPLEQSEIDTGKGPTSPRRIKYEEWSQMREIYDMKDSKTMDELPDYAAFVGNILEGCVDHGTFYKPTYGFCKRDFVQDPDRGWVLEIDYDVFPPGSFCGVYIRVHPLKFFDYTSLSFWARGDSVEGIPDIFEIEFKQRSRIWSVFKIDDLTSEWKKFTFPIEVIPDALVNEVTIVFKNYPVGRNKHGTIYIDDFSLKKKTRAEVEASLPKQSKRSRRPSSKAGSPQKT